MGGSDLGGRMRKDGEEALADLVPMLSNTSRPDPQEVRHDSHRARRCLVERVRESAMH